MPGKKDSAIKHLLTSLDRVELELNEILDYDDVPIEDLEGFFSNIANMMYNAQVIRGQHIIIESILQIREERCFNSKKDESDEEKREPVEENDVCGNLYDALGFEDDNFVRIILGVVKNKGLIGYRAREGLVVTKKGLKYLKQWKSLENKVIDELPIQWFKCPNCDYGLHDYNFSEHWRSKPES